MPKSLPVSEIHRKHYSNFSKEDFLKIVSSDTISSNLQKDKLGKYAKWLLKNTNFTPSLKVLKMK